MNPVRNASPARPRSYSVRMRPLFISRYPSRSQGMQRKDTWWVSRIPIAGLRHSDATMAARRRNGYMPAVEQHLCDPVKRALASGKPGPRARAPPIFILQIWRGEAKPGGSAPQPHACSPRAGPLSALKARTRGYPDHDVAFPNPDAAYRRGVLHRDRPHHHELADQFRGAEPGPAAGGADVGWPEPPARAGLRPDPPP